VEAALQAGAWRVISWFDRVRVRKVSEEEMRRIDPSGRAFWNVNTPEEFARAEEAARGEE
jgi:molybdopterin-guanine dinucleotide biosynthesis protein A